MSAKNRDEHNRWRNVTVAFRVSPEEDKLIETAVRLSGLTKQDYITRRLTDREVGWCRAIRGCSRRCGTSSPPCWTSCGALRLGQASMTTC